MDFASFHQAHGAKIRAEIYAYTGDPATAYEVTNRAFGQALSRWGKLDGDPVHWVRTAAFELAQPFVKRAGGPPTPAGPAAAVLAGIKPFERRLVILHYLAWLSAADIAERDRVYETQVRKWLDDARAALSGPAVPYAVAGDPVAGLMAKVREEADQGAPLPDAAALSTVATKRKNRLVALVGAAAVVAITVPVAIVTLSRSDDQDGATPATLTATSSPTADAPTPTPAPTLVHGPEAKLTLKDFETNPVDLNIRQGKWGTCPLRGVTFKNGRAIGTQTNKLAGTGVPVADIKKLIHVDVDGDGLAETVGLIKCWVPDAAGSGSDYEVDVFDRDSDGKIYTLVTLVKQPYGTTDDTEYNPALTDLKPGAGGAVDVEFADFDACCVAPVVPLKHWRTFTLTRTANGTEVSQSGGATDWPPNRYVTDLAVEVTVARAGAGKATVTGTVTNNGPSPAGLIYLTYSLPNGASSSGVKGMSDCRSGSDEKKRNVIHVCRMAPLPVNDAVLFSVTVTYPPSTQDIPFLAFQRLGGHYDAKTLPDSGKSTATSPSFNNYASADLP